MNMTNPISEPVYVVDEDTKKQINEIYKAIYVGNGKASLMTRIAALEGKMTVVGWVGMTFALLVIGFLFAVLTHQATFNP